MGLVKKAKVGKYWSKDSMTATPYFGRTLTRQKFEMIMANLHLADDTLNTQNDPLHKLRPFIDMCDRTFKHYYKPGKNICLDEASVPFKGFYHYTLLILHLQFIQ